MTTTQTATILVTDLVGSTELRASLGEDRAESVRRAHDRSLVDAAQTHGGTVVKGLGDGVLVMFAGAAEAVAAAVDMQRAVDLQARSEGLGLAIRVGVSAGDVTLEDGDCFGTPVVEASRLCAAADGGQILVAEVVRVLARGRGGHEMTSVGDLDLKGLPEPVPAFSVGWAPAATVGDLRIRTPYVGREAERELLADRLGAAARDGHGGLVLVAGEPGIGKTRIVDEACSATDDLLVLVGGCHDGDVVAYSPFVEALSDWVRRSPSAAVAAALGRDAAVVARIVPAIRDVLPETGDPLPVAADEETARLHDAVGQVFARLSESTTVALVVEDLHWADDATVGMLRAMARLSTRTRLVVIGTYRETDLDRRHPFGEALPLLQREVEPTRIALDGLAPDDVQALLERLSGHDVPEAFSTLLATETDGNPFFLRETLLHLVEEGHLRVENGVWVADADQGLSIPAGVRDVVGRRLSRLSPDTNKLLAAGALFEVSFPLAITSAVTDIGEDESLDAIDEALDARVVAATDEFDRYVFTHALFRHTLVEELNPSRQVRMHRAIAEAIEKDLRGAPDPGTAATLARHYLRSAAIPGAERGVPYAVAVADDAANRYARHEELTATRTALELLEPGDDREVELRLRAARAAVLARVDADEQVAVAEEAGGLLEHEESADAACDFVTELVITSRQLDDAELCWRLASVARRWLTPERRDREWCALRELELEERDFRDPDAAGIPTDDDEYRELRRVLFTLPAAETSRFTRCAAPESCDDALSRPEELGIVGVGWSLGQPRDSLYPFDNIIDRTRQEGLVPLEAVAISMRSRCWMYLGEFEQADADQSEALALLPRLSPESNPFMQILASDLLRGQLCGQLITPDEIDMILSFADRPGTHWAGLAIKLSAAAGLAQLGDTQRALELLSGSMPAIDRAAAWAPNAPMVLAYAAQTVWLTESTDHRAELGRNLRQKWLDTGLGYPGFDARASVALLSALDGRTDEARDFFTQARQVLTETGCEPVIVQVDFNEATMELRLGVDGDAARFAERLASARSRCTHPAMAPWLPRLDELEADGAKVF